MMFLVAVCLIIVFAYLARAGLHEKRLYEENTDAIERNADEGVFGDLKNKVSPVSQASGDSIAEDDSRLARGTARMQQYTDKLGNKFEERANKIRDKDESSSLFGKVADKVRNKEESAGLFAKVANKVQGNDENNTVFNKVKDKINGGDSENPLEKIAAKVGGKADFVDRKIQAQRDSNESADEALAKEKDSFIGRMIDKVGAASDKVEARMESKVKAAGENKSEDFITKMSGKIGGKINDLDDRAVDRGRKMVK